VIIVICSGMELSMHGPLRRAVSWVARVPRLIGRGLILAYRYSLSPLIGFDCRHLPTCSVYAEEAIGRFGLWAGGWMTLARLCRCHPFGTSGLDFVPAAPPAGAHWYLPWRYGRWRGTNAGESSVTGP
jgi:putative membrane protein insertion efficiency factor